VGNPRSNSGHAAEVWLPKELRRQSREEENGNAGLADHAVVDAETVREQTPPEGEQWLLDDRSADSTTRQEQRESDVQEAIERQAGLEAQLAKLEERLQAREAELLGEARRREAELNARIEELQSALANANHSAGPATKPSLQPAPAKKGKADLNSATFEELRDLGLSVTQCARLISYRDSRQGFDSLDEIDAVPGFPDELRRTLKDQIQLG
jgi:DNA uptake protein ComE-like DNA-binding protein